MDEFLKIQKEYLDELIKLESKKLVGKTMKRIELGGNNISSIKKQIKELIYEGYRDFRSLLFAHNYGLDVQTFTYNNNQEDKLNSDISL